MLVLVLGLLVASTGVRCCCGVRLIYCTILFEFASIRPTFTKFPIFIFTLAHMCREVLSTATLIHTFVRSDTINTIIFMTCVDFCRCISPYAKPSSYGDTSFCFINDDQTKKDMKRVSISTMHVIQYALCKPERIVLTNVFHI